MKSMTGFGYREISAGNVQVTAELKSYNNRYLDVYAYVPPSLSPLEPRIRAFIAERVVRGRVEVSLKIRETEEAVSVSVDRGTVTSYLAAVKEVAEICGFSEEVRLSHLLRLDGIIKTDRTRDIEEYWRAVLPALEGAFEDYEAQRIREGEATKKDVVRHLDIIRSSVGTIEEKVPELEAYFTGQIRSRFEELVRDQIDENRVLSEVALLLVKYSVNEEVVRLKSHLEGFIAVMDEGGSVGKKLDFICQ
jgi:uncharacterized protein (TIGR00255 family)